MSGDRKDEEQVSRRGFFRLGILRAARTASDAMSEVGKQFQKAAGMAREGHDAEPMPDPSYASYPPGAGLRVHFETHCTKCEDCITACPAWAIRKDREGRGYPVIEPNETACAVCDDPLPCIAACPTPALSLTPRESIRLGLARVDASTCVVPHGQVCDFCVTYCPIPEVAIRMEAGGPVIIETGCTGCGMCAVMCPEDAIRIGGLLSASGANG